MASAHSDPDRYWCRQKSFVVGAAITAVLTSTLSAEVADRSAFPVLPAQVDGYLSGPSPSMSIPGTGLWQYKFPQDLFAHKRHRSEIWILHALLKTEDDNTLALQSRFYRTAINPPPLSDAASSATSAWQFHEIFASSHRLTDVDSDTFISAESVSRGALQLAGSQDYQPDKPSKGRVWVNGNQLEVKQDNRCQLDLALKAWIDQLPVDIQLHGKQCAQLADAEFSSTTIFGFAKLLNTVKGQVGEMSLTGGRAWLERAWGDLPTGNSPVVTNQFRLVLPGERYLTIMQTRRRDGSGRPVLSAALLSAGQRLTLNYRQLMLTETAQWSSASSGLRYSSAWQLSLPETSVPVTGTEVSGIAINPATAMTISAVQPDQEIVSLGQHRWSGLVVATWQKDGKAQSAFGFADLEPLPADTTRR